MGKTLPMVRSAIHNIMNNKLLEVIVNQHTLLATVHKLTSVHALSRDEILLNLAELVRVAELNDCQRCAATGVVDDFLDDALHVAVALGVVELAELGRTLAVSVDRLKQNKQTVQPIYQNAYAEDTAGTLPLSYNNNNKLKETKISQPYLE